LYDRLAHTWWDEHAWLSSTKAETLDAASSLRLLLGKGEAMAEIVFAIPVLPGKEELDQQTLDEMSGPRRDEYEAALKDAGITRQAIWHQQTPNGTLALVYIEADDPDRAQRFASSDAAISRWFVERMQEVHGVDVSQSFPPVNQVHDFRV
jgi:hypothetical protein